MVGAADPPSTIGECSERCFKLFSQGPNTVSLLPHDNASRVKASFEDEFARFKLWASNIGVFAEVHASLDFRVRELPEVKELFLRQLDTIECRLGQLCEDVEAKDVREDQAVGGAEQSSSPVATPEAEDANASFEKWDVKETLESIHESVDWLHRLSNWVRKASFVNQNRRAKVFLLRDSKGNESQELTDEMTTGLRNVYKYFVKHNTEDLDENLRDRLIETMITRHIRILYRRSRQMSWAISKVHYAARKVDTPTNSQNPITSEQTSIIQQRQPKPLKVTPRPMIERITTPPENPRPATTVNVDIYGTLSRATSAPWRNEDGMPFPLPPRAASMGEDFVCPYCCLILPSREALNHMTWAAHVKKDLDAYFCVFKECDSPYEIYSSSKEWLSHMSTRHRMRWQCFATGHEPLLCKTSEDFETHMRTVHAGSFSDKQLPFILEISAQPITPTLEHCPFCSISDGDIEGHVSGHLREFALRSLPLPDEIPLPDDAGGRSEDIKTDTMDSKENTRETVREARDSLPPFENTQDERYSEETSNSEPDRLEQYGRIPVIAAQHEPLHDDLELLKDKHIEAFACKQYGVANKEALLSLLAAQPDGDVMNVTLHHRSAETAFYNTTYGTDKFIPGTTAQEDELFSNTLYSHIRHSVFDSSVRKFLPEGTLDMILNRDSVFEAMEVEGPNVDDESLADFVLAYARRVFAISIYIGLEDAKLRKAMLLCKEHGINDRKLPIAYTQDVSLNVLARLENSVDQKRRIWNLRRINKFCEEQWSFLAPVFSTAIFNHDLHPNAVLPFTRKHDIVNGSFGQVYKYEIHPHHFKDPLNPGKSCPDFFAVKEMRSVEKVVANWEREVKTLVMLNSLNQDHIVRFITAFSRRQADREDYCLMFEWANGGNLCDFWKATPQPTLQASFVKAVLKQLLGLAKALCAAHYLNTSGASIRHGDLKPENILWFQDLDEIGRLKIGDWGIAKQNNIGTEMRAEQTTSQWGTLRYAAPEVETGVRGIYFGQTPKRRSRLYDVWAMGCITLEFIIWLLYGWAEVKRLRFNLGGERAPFYQISQDESGTKIARVHSVAVQWMEHMAKDPACQAGTTALGDLLEVVKTGLLVVNLPRRMGSNLMNPQEALFNPFSLDARPHKQLPDEPDEPVLLEPSDPQETPLRGMPIPSLEITEPVRVPLLPEPEIRRDVRFLATDLRNRLENILVGDYESDNYWSPDAPRLPPPESPDDPSNSLTQGETEYRTESTALSISDLLASKGLVAPTEIVDYAHPRLDNDWEIHVDNKFASRLLASHVATFEGSSSYESAQNHEALRLCSQCKYVRDDLWSPGFSITYEVRSLKARATLKECGLCGLFWRTCEKHSGTTFPTVQFGRVESSLKMNGGNTNVLSLLRSPDLNTRIDDHIQIGHAELPKAGQPAHLEVIRQWLNNCDDNHKHSTCQPPKHDSRFNDKRKLPTRLIDVGKAGDTTVRLLETGANDSGEWVALSHPWGPSPHFVTTRNNLAEHIKGINLKTLAGTFRDAVVVTRALGRRYLWIDCVCIIQGRDGDFIQEVKRMEEVFSGAYCVIQANCASDHFSGFLQPRNVRDYVALRRDGGAFFYICEMIDDFESHVLEGALNQRAWILQEHALARRTIFFTEHQTYWECGEGVRCETGMRMNNNLAALLGDPNFPQLVEAAPFGERILRYQDLYATYSRLLLVNPADRPLAIRGLEIRLLRTMQARGGFGVFDQGPNKGLLCRSLLWHRGDDEATLHRINFPPERGGVPSWSWMAYTGGIDYLGIEFGQVEWEDVTLHWLESKAVAVAGGARTEIVEDDERVGRALRAVVREYDTGAADVGGGRLVLDTPGGSEKLETLCVVLGRQKQQGAKTEDRNCYVLVVANAGGGEARRSRWERVGAGILPMKCIASEGEDIEIY